MTTTLSPTNNPEKIAQAQKALAQLLELALRRGFFGDISVELKVQDGIIQVVRRKMEQIER